MRGAEGRLLEAMKKRDLATVDQDLIEAEEDNIFKRNVVIRPRKPKYQTNFI